MGKLGFTMSSLVAAVPGAFLCYLMVATFLTRFEAMSGTFQGLLITTLILALVVALMPLAILVFYKSPSYSKAGNTNAAATGAIDSEDDLATDATWGESDEFDADGDDAPSEFDSVADDEISDDEIEAFDDDDFEDDFEEDDSGDELSDEFAFDDDDFEEEEDI